MSQNEQTKPLIAVTGPEKNGFTAWFFGALYVYLAGGKPVRVQAHKDIDITQFDGFVLGGGSDIHPDHCELVRVEGRRAKASRWAFLKEALRFPVQAFERLFGQIKHDKERDLMEIRCIEFAVKNKLPILGICRGHQLINAYFGGKIYESTEPIYGDKPVIRSALPRKNISINPKAPLLFGIFGQSLTQVNALHHQAVAALGKGLRVAATETVGINQASESSTNLPILTVQWHPEYMFYDKSQRLIFEWVVETARESIRDQKYKKAN